MSRRLSERLARSVRDLRLVPVAVVAWIGAALLVGAPDASGAAASAAWAAVVIALAAAVLARRRPAVRDGLAALTLSIAALALVATAVSLRADLRAPPAIEALRGTVEVRLVVTEDMAAGDERLRGTVSAFGEIAAASPVLVVGARVDEDIGIGATARLRGEISPLPPGGSIAALVIASEPAVEVLAPPPRWMGWGDELRAGFRQLATGLPGDGAALLTGLAIGDDRGLPAPLADAMRSSSLTHLTAVSGANCAIVVGAVMLGGGLIRLRRRWRIALSIIVLCAFVVLVTPQPSVVRAAVMAAFALGGLALARPMAGLPLLSVAVAGILVADPWASREIGFVLSVLATTGLLVLSGPLSRLIGVALPRPLALALAVPIAAQLACQPAIAILDPTLPVYGVLANLIAVPAAPLATVAGLIACLLAPVAPPLALLAAWLAWLPSTWIAGVATTFAEFPGARLPWPPALPGVLLHALVAVAVAAAAFGRRRLRFVGAMVIGSVAIAYVGAFSMWQVLGVHGRPSDWRIAMCDVGQGDAAVVRSHGMVAVVDAGPEPEALTVCLAALGIGRVDLLVLSHFDRDHVGGVAALVGRTAVVLAGPADADAARRVLDPLESGGARIERVARGDAGMLGDLVWRVLWPGPDASEPGNAASVVVRFDPLGDAAAAGAVSSVFLGDLGESEQAAMLRAGPVGSADVVKVAHHGSADQSATLYGMVRAPVALIGVGAENGYGHPTDRLLEVLERNGSQLGRTDLDGMLLVARSDGSLTLWRERGG